MKHASNVFPYLGKPKAAKSLRWVTENKGATVIQNLSVKIDLVLFMGDL